MASFEAAISKVVREYAPIAALVSGRVHPDTLPQNTALPAISYEVVADVPFDTIDGNASLYRGVIEFKIWSKNETESSNLEEFIRRAIQGYQGVSLDVKIRGVHHLHRTDDYEAEVGEHNQLPRYSVLYRRENPA